MTSKNQTITIEIPKTYKEEYLTTLPDWEKYKSKIIGADHFEFDQKYCDNPNINGLHDIFLMNSNYFNNNRIDRFEYHGIEYLINQKDPLSLPCNDLDKGLFFKCIKHLLDNLSSIEECETLIDALPKGILKSRPVKKENTSAITGKTSISWSRQHFLMFKGKRHGVKLKELEAVKSRISFRNKVFDLLCALKDGVRKLLGLLGLNCDIDILTKRKFLSRLEYAHNINGKNRSEMMRRYENITNRGDILSIDNTYVASKNEAIIGNILSMYSWPYFNEYPVYASKHSNGKYVSTVDFLFPAAVSYMAAPKNHRGSALQDHIYVEIFGKLDDDPYLEGVRSKITNYASIGIIPGYNFIGFACGDPRSVNSRKIFEVITLALMGFIPKDIVVV